MQNINAIRVILSSKDQHINADATYNTQDSVFVILLVLVVVSICCFDVAIVSISVRRVKF